MKIFSEELVEKAVKELHIANLAQATIGDVLLVAQYLEKETGIPFIRMDQGSPGLAANQIGIEAEKAALDRGVGSQYPAAAGVPELKKEASRFVKAFLNLDISPRACVPTTGSVAGSFGSFIACTLQSRDKGGIADIQLIRRYAFHLQRLTAYCVFKMYVHFAQKMSRINANVVQ